MTQFSALQAARAHARAHSLREKAVCQITRRTPRAWDMDLFLPSPTLTEPSLNDVPRHKENIA